MLTTKNIVSLSLASLIASAGVGLAEPSENAGMSTETVAGEPVEVDREITGYTDPYSLGRSGQTAIKPIETVTYETVNSVTVTNRVGRNVPGLSSIETTTTTETELGEQINCNSTTLC